MTEAIGEVGRKGDVVPLCVDLDGTLIHSDVLWESGIQLWRRPVIVLRALFLLCLHGKAAMKSFLAGFVSIDPASLPYREDVLLYIREHAAHRPLVLATATHRLYAHQIADYLGLFSAVFATNGKNNLSGIRKRDALVSAYGLKGFDYIGDSRKDVPIFAASRESLLVDPSTNLKKRVSSVGVVSRVFRTQKSWPKMLAKAMRLHQWAKNALIAVPLLTAHLVLDVQAWIDTAFAFLAFGLVASSTYLLNDLVDLQADRLHVKKRFRPLASGALSIPHGLVLAAISGVLGFAVAAIFLSTAFGAYLIVYVAVTLSYSLSLKRKLMIDVLTLAMLYALRILAGGVAIGVAVSGWLLMFSLFIFLSLAFLKRAIELAGSTSSVKLAGRGYGPGDMIVVKIMGISSGLASVLVLALYISSPDIAQLYRAPQVLWLICPLVLYWVARIWFLAERNEVDTDPVVFALFDKRSYLVGLMGLTVAFLATVGPMQLATQISR